METNRSLACDVMNIILTIIWELIGYMLVNSLPGRSSVARNLCWYLKTNSMCVRVCRAGEFGATSKSTEHILQARLRGELCEITRTTYVVTSGRSYGNGFKVDIEHRPVSSARFTTYGGLWQQFFRNRPHIIPDPKEVSLLDVAERIHVRFPVLPSPLLRPWLGNPKSEK